MGKEKITCLMDIINELKAIKGETLIDSDVPGRKYVPPGHGFRYKREEKKQKTFILKVTGQSTHYLFRMYNIECCDGCGSSGFLFYSRDLSKNKKYKIGGYPALNKNDCLIIVAKESYFDFNRRLESFLSFSW